MSDVVLTLSIGFMVPLLGFIFATSIISRCLMWEVLVDRFLSQPYDSISRATCGPCG